MKKINIFFTIALIGILLYASTVHAKTKVTLDNIEYVSWGDTLDAWEVGEDYHHQNLAYGDVYIRDSIEGKPVIRIAVGAFNGGKVQRVNIPLSVKKIGSCAFENSDIRELTIPKSVQDMGSYVATDCKELETVYWNTRLVKKVPLATFDGCKKLKTIQFVPGIVEIGPRMFADCISLKKIVLPNTVKTIRINAFERCTNLEEIYIPASVRDIPGNAFDDVKNLVIKAPKYSYAHYYARACGIRFKAVGTPLEPITNRPLIKKIQLNGNTLKTYLYNAVTGADFYTFYVVSEFTVYDEKNDFDSMSTVRKVRTTKPAVTMYNLEQGNQQVYCKATLKNGKEIWSSDVTFTVQNPPVEPPKINKVRVNGRNITVSLSLPENCKGYDSVLTTRYCGIAAQEEVCYVIKNRTKATVTFKNVAPGTYYFAAHAFVREKINTGCKVFSKWASRPNKIVIK